MALGLFGVFLSARMFLGRRRIVAVLVVTIMLLASIPYMAGAVSRLGSTIMLDTFLERSRPHLALHLWFPGPVDSGVLDGASLDVSGSLERLGFEAWSRVYVVEAGLAVVGEQGGGGPPVPSHPSDEVVRVLDDTIMINGRVYRVVPIYLVIAPRSLDPGALGLAGEKIPISSPGGGVVDVVVASAHPLASTTVEVGGFQVLGVDYRVLGHAPAGLGIAVESITSYRLYDDGFGMYRAWGYAIFLYTASDDPEVLALGIASRYAEAASSGEVLSRELAEAVEQAARGGPAVLPPRPLIEAMDNGLSPEAAGRLVSMVIMADYKPGSLVDYVIQGDVNRFLSQVEARIGESLLEDAGVCLAGLDIVGQYVRTGGSTPLCSPGAGGPAIKPSPRQSY